MKKFSLGMLSFLLAVMFFLTGCSVSLAVPGISNQTTAESEETTVAPEGETTTEPEETTVIPEDETTTEPEDETTDVPVDVTTDKPEEVTTAEPEEETTTVPKEPALAAPSDDCNMPSLANTTLEIVSGGASGFKIVYASEGYGDYSKNTAWDSDKKIYPIYNLFKEQADSLATSLKSRFGVTVPVVEDISSTPSATTKEILVGPTNRSQSDTAMMFCQGSDGFVIKAIGKKLVINCFEQDMIDEAMNYFILNILGSGGNSYTFKSSDDYCSNQTYKYSARKLAGYSYKIYTIVVSKDAKYSELRAAKQIQYLIASKVGVIPMIVFDTDKGHNQNFEIRIGSTSRTSLSTKNVGKNEYVFAMNKASLEICAGSTFAMEEAMAWAELSFLSKMNNAEYNAGELSRKNVAVAIDKKGTPSASGKLGEIRLLVHNVWGWHEQNAMGVWGCAPVRYTSAQQRNLSLAEIYLDLDVDVIALQEYTDRLMRKDTNYDISPTLAAAGYSQVYLMSGGKTSQTPIFYKTDKFELLESEIVDLRSKYPGCGDDKFMTTAVLKQKSDGKVFAVISIHKDYRGEDVADANRLNMAKDAIKKANSIRTKYSDCPVFVCGDFNCTQNSDPYREYVNSGYSDILNVAEKKDTGKTTFNPKWNKDKMLFITDTSVLGSAENSIDHIMTNGSYAECLRYDILTDVASASISDHAPHVLDFNLK